MLNHSIKVFLTVCWLALASQLAAQSFEYINTIPATADAQLTSPDAVAINSRGHVYIANSSTKAIHVYDENGVQLEIIYSVSTREGFTALKKPTALYVDVHDQLYIYDADAGSIFIRPISGEGRKIGEKGSSKGQIDNITSIAADSEGYVYALNVQKKEVSVFSPDGHFVTWINGGSEPFKSVVAIGVNGRNELYVLEREGPTVYMFNQLGRLVNVDRNLNRQSQNVLEEALELAVLHTGEFFILDNLKQQLRYYDRLGDSKGMLGAKGKNAPGVFEDIISIACHHGEVTRLVALDAQTKQAQVFQINNKPLPIVPEDRALTLNYKTQASEGYHLIRNGSSNLMAVVFANDLHRITLIQDHISTKIPIEFGEIADMRFDRNNRLYVLDAKKNEISVFNSKGTAIQKFGQDLKWKSPVSLVIQPEGNIVACDESNSKIHFWNQDGVLLKSISDKENAAIPHPHHLETDRKGQLYIWDKGENTIFRTGINGWPTSPAKLRVRGDKAGDNNGEIGGFFIDPMDLVHVYNKSNGQLEIYSWKESPELLYTIGYPGEGINGFAQVENIQFDASLFEHHFLHEDGTEMIYRFVVIPPSPEDQMAIDVNGADLQFTLNPIADASVIEYGLLRHDESGNDTLVYRTTKPQLSLRLPATDDVSLHSYSAVSISPTGISKGNKAVPDYLSYAKALISVRQYDDALIAFRNATLYMGKSPGMASYISKEMRATGESLSAKNETSKALQYLRESFLLAPLEAGSKQSLQSAYFHYFMQLANKEEYDQLIVEAERAMNQNAVKPIILSAIDSLSLTLSELPSEHTIDRALMLQKKHSEWEPNNPLVNANTAHILFDLYELRRNKGIAAKEINLLLAQIQAESQLAVNGLKSAGLAHFEPHLLQLHVLNEFDKFTDVESQALKELTESSYRLTPLLVKRYRVELARAYEGQEKYESAIKEYEHVLSLDANDKSSQGPLAEVYVKAKHYDDAKLLYQQMLSTDRNNSTLIARIGEVELLKGNYVEASFQLEKAVKMDPSNGAIYGPLAKAFEGANLAQQAILNYTIAIHYQIAHVEQTEASNAGTKESLAAQQLLNDYLLRCATLNEQVGDYDAAIEKYELLTTYNPKSPEAFYGLGKAYLSAGYVYNAEKALNTAVSLDPSKEQYTSTLDSALKMRQNSSGEEVKLQIVDLKVNDIFPSLYRNYADVKLLPIGEVIIANNSSQSITPSGISVFVPELMSQPTEIKSPAILAFSNARVKLPAVFTDKILQTANAKTLQLEVVVHYSMNKADKKIKQTVPIQLMARNAITWSDKRRLGAFVSSNEEALINYNKAGDQIFRNQPHYGLNRNLIKAMQNYTLLNHSNFVYSPDPVQSFATVSTNTDIMDYLQYPAETIKRKSGDCDDLVAAYCGVLENAGIATAYIDVPGHVFMAFNTQIPAEEMSLAGFNPLDVIISENKVWIPIETTLLGNKDFLVAWKKGAERYYSELKQGHFPELVSLSNARNVYVSSNYVPADFAETPPSDESVSKDYAELLKQVLAKTKKELITEMEARYLVEPNNVFVKNKFATLLAQIGENKQAEQIFLEALELAPENSTVINNLGNIYYQRGNASKAIEYYGAASKIDTKDAEIIVNLCKANLLAGNTNEARVLFAKAVSLDPEIETIYSSLQSQIK